MESRTHELMVSCHKVLLLKPWDCLVIDSGYSPLHGIPLLFRYSGPGFCLFLPRRSYKHWSKPQSLRSAGGIPDVLVFWASPAFITHTQPVPLDTLCSCFWTLKNNRGSPVWYTWGWFVDMIPSSGISGERSTEVHDSLCYGLGKFQCMTKT